MMSQVRRAISPKAMSVSRPAPASVRENIRGIHLLSSFHHFIQGVFLRVRRGIAHQHSDLLAPIAPLSQITRVDSVRRHQDCFALRPG